MLITRSGFKSFNEYDLSAVLEAQLQRLRKEIQSYIKSKQETRISILTERYKIEPLNFNTDKLTVSVKTAKIPAEYFPSDFFVRSGKSYEKKVLAFHLPFSGDVELLRCVPSTRILWTEEIALENNEVVFELIKFTDNAEYITKEKDRIINYLTQQAANINKQVEQYNNSIDAIIKETQTQTYIQLSKQDEFLKKLGVPLRDETSFISESPNKRQTESSVIEKKQQTFDVFICHASEDKDYVDKLATALKDNNIAVWYDAFQIGWGDDLRPAIDNGLKNSRFGIVVFSKSFLNKKKWTEYELNGLFSKEKNGRKVILPIWHNITREDVSQYSPTFADRIAKRSDDISSIIKELKELLKK